eukprot:g31677.t1
MKALVAKKLQASREEVARLLSLATSLGEVMIVTLSKDSWVAESSRNFFPGLQERERRRQSSAAKPGESMLSFSSRLKAEAGTAGHAWFRAPRSRADGAMGNPCSCSVNAPETVQVVDLRSEVVCDGVPRFKCFIQDGVIHWHDGGTTVLGPQMTINYQGQDGLGDWVAT